MELEDNTRKQVARFLPKAIKAAFESYYEYVDSDWRGEGDKKPTPKLFAEHHAACKAALSHIELLLKLGKGAGVETRADHTHLAVIRQAAMDDLNAFRAQEVPDTEKKDA